VLLCGIFAYASLAHKVSFLLLVLELGERAVSTCTPYDSNGRA
jgi:hypothetical protein